MVVAAAAACACGKEVLTAATTSLPVAPAVSMDEMADAIIGG